MRRIYESPDEYSSRTFKRVQMLCRRFGYELDEDSCLEVMGNTRYLTIGITPDGSNKYAPSIYGPTRAKDKKILQGVTFTIQTSSVGALNITEYEEYLEACENAYKLVNVLSGVDFSGFPEVVED